MPYPAAQGGGKGQGRLQERAAQRGHLCPVLPDVVFDGRKEWTRILS